MRISTFLVSLFTFLLTVVPLAPGDVRAQTTGTGLLFDDAAYERVPRAATLMRGDYDDLPARASLKTFAPYAGNQGTTSMCVGWSTGYAARTIVEAVEQGWTDRAAITERAYSPAYVYNQLRDTGSDPECLAGSYLTWALDLLENEGVAPIEGFPASCDRLVTPDDELRAAEHRIIGYHRLFQKSSSNKTLPVKKALSEGKPIVIGMMVTTSFMNQVGTDVWQPPAGEPADAGGHAMAVVGYDDDKHGGAFEIMNSWGDRWGNEGFIWMPYDVFEEYVYYGFEVFAEPRAADKPVALGGALALTLSSGEPMTATLDEGRFRMDEAYPSFTTFKAHVTNAAPAYVYAFGADLTRKATRLIPLEESTSAYLPYAEASVPLLGEDQYLELDARTGTDYLAVLYTDRELDLDAVVVRMETEEGAFMDRLRAVLGEKLADPASVTYRADGVIGFSAEVPAGSVVPLVVEIEHTALPTDVDRTPPQLALLTPAAEADGTGRLAVERPAHTDRIVLTGTALDESGAPAVTVAGADVAVDAEGVFRHEVDLGTLSGDRFEVAAEDAAGNRSRLVVRLVEPVRDLEAPVVAVSEPRVVRGGMRGLTVTSESRPVTVRGTVEDPAGVEGVYVNGIAAEVRPDGSFTAEIRLAGRDRRIRVEATDAAGNASNDVFYVLAEEETEEEIVGRAGYYESEKPYVSVDVFYGTDRGRTGSAEPNTFYGGARGRLEFGKVTVSIPKGHTVGEMESPAWWRFEFSEDPAEHVMLQRVEPMPKQEMLRGLRAAVQRSGRNEAFVFVHGYNVSFRNAARRTAQLAHDVGFDGAPIMYSWPSDAELARYTADEADVAWTVPHLASFLKDVARRSGAKQVHLVAHSMGSRALAGALTEIAREQEEPLFGHVIFTAPDIDADVFERDIAPLLPRAAQQTTLYASSDDKALIASRKVHGYPRAGESGVGLVVSEYLDTVDASGIDTDLLGHSYFAETEQLLRDIYATVVSDLPPERRELIRQVRSVLSYWRLPF